MKGLYLFWALIPEDMLRSIGIFYYPDKYWALAIPCWASFTLFSLPFFYLGLNLLNNVPLHSFETITDEHALQYDSRERREEDIDPISDIPLSIVNELLFKSERDN